MNQRLAGGNDNEGIDSQLDARRVATGAHNGRGNGALGYRNYAFFTPGEGFGCLFVPKLLHKDLA